MFYASLVVSVCTSATTWWVRLVRRLIWPQPELINNRSEIKLIFLNWSWAQMNKSIPHLVRQNVDQIGSGPKTCYIKGQVQQSSHLINSSHYWTNQPTILHASTNAGTFQITLLLSSINFIPRFSLYSPKLNDSIFIIKSWENKLFQ